MTCGIRDTQNIKKHTHTHTHTKKKKKKGRKYARRYQACGAHRNDLSRERIRCYFQITRIDSWSRLKVFSCCLSKKSPDVGCEEVPYNLAVKYLKERLPHKQLLTLRMLLPLKE